MKSWKQFIVIFAIITVMSSLASSIGICFSKIGFNAGDKDVTYAFQDSVNAKEVDNNQGARADENNGGSTLNYGNGSRNDKVDDDPQPEKVVYLSFDDGPNRIITPKVLQILDQYQIPATFFVIGTSVEQSPEVLKEIVEKGHAVGNHTYTHRYEDVYSSPEAFLGSLRANEQIIYKIAGIKTKIYRDPGGELRTNEHFQRYLAERGYVRAEWNVESYDSRKPKRSSEKILEDIVAQVEARRDLWGNLIILMHDSPGHENSVQALPKVIEYFQKQGFVFKKLPTLQD